MKIFKIIFIFLIVLCGKLSAQTVQGTLSETTALKIEDKIVVSGVDKEDNFKAILYDKDLNVLKEYNRKYDKETKKHSELKIINSTLVCVFYSGLMKPKGKIVKLTTSLEEISSKPFSAEDFYKKNPDEYAKIFERPDDVNNNKNFIQLPSRTIVSKNTLYINTKCNEYLNSSGTNMTIPGSEENFVIHTVVYDSAQKRYIVGGNFYNEAKNSDKVKMKGMALLVLNKNGEIVKTKKINFPEYNFKEPDSYDIKDKMSYVDAIIIMPSGNIVLNCTNTAKYFRQLSPVQGISPMFTLGNRHVPVGFSYYELSSELEEIVSLFYTFPQIKDYRLARHLSSSANGRHILFGNARFKELRTFVDEISSETLLFDNPSKPELKKNYSYNAKGAFQPEVNVHPFQSHFLIDDNTVIIFRPEKNSYELKVVKL